jgi:subtilisin family serine protease/flagellar hook assembly protein FlgD
VPVVGALLLALVVGPSTALAAPQPDRGRSGTVRLGVDLRPGADAPSVEASAEARGGARSHRLDRLGYLSLTVPAGAADALAGALRRRTDVAAVSPVATRRASYVPDDSLWGTQQGYLTAVAGPAAWDLTHGSASVKVAVIDTGVDVGHPDLAGKVVATHETMSSTPSTTDVTDNVGHGTHVAGIAAAASDNGLGVVGTGFDAAVMAVKAGDVDGFWDDDLAAAITWAADNGARVINMSLGGPGTTPVLSDAVSYAQAHGVLVVAAAGNEGTETMSYPAALPGVVAVGATDANGGRAWFSNYGSWVTVAAPGVGILSTVPTAGSQMAAAPTSGYSQANGTSMAAPIVAGQAALLMAGVPSLNADQVRQAIVSSAHGYAGLGLGTGQVDLAASLALFLPTTAPVVTAPSGGAVVSGSTALSATSDAPSVSFLVDGTPLGAPVAVSGGAASTTWPTWGVQNGAHQVSARPCNALGCGPVSATVAVTVDNHSVAIASPTSGAAVGGVVGVDVTTSDATPAVQLLVDGAAVGSRVAVASSAAHLVWDSAGYANGDHVLGVAPCTAQGGCGSPVAVTVSLQNAAPGLTSPAAGQLVTGQVTLAASSTARGVRFLLDGAPIGFDATAPFTVVKNFTTVANGTHLVTLQSCNASGSRCAGPASTVQVSVKSLHPALKAAWPSVISPNGDRRADTSKLTYSLPDTQVVSWSVRNAAGKVVRGPVLLGKLTAGTRTFVWNGRTSTGARAADGTYTVWLATRRTSGTLTLRGLATRAVRVDTVAPTMSVTAVTSTFYPVRDGFRDVLAPKAVVNEPGTTTMTVRNSAGTVVRTLVVRSSKAGTRTLAWNGRTSNGTLQPAGTYRYTLRSEDVAGNRRAWITYRAPLSWKRLVGTSVTKTVTPAASATARIQGSCSRVADDAAWTGGYDYLSAYSLFGGTCAGESEPGMDLAGSLHELVLPAAVKYTGLSVAATGQRAVAEYADTADAWYRDRYGKPVNPVTLAAALGSHSLGAASSSLLYNGRTLRWAVRTTAGRWYAVKSFTVRYTYYVLK